MSVRELTASFVLVLAGCLLASQIGSNHLAMRDTLALSLLLASAALATAPAATLSVLQEYEAKGPVTDTILGLTAINNIACIVVFSCVFTLLIGLGAIHTGAEVALRPLPALILSTLGSVMLGFFLGAVLAILHARMSPAESLLVLCSMIILLGVAEPWLRANAGASHSFLLTALVLGAVFANVAIDAQRLSEAVRSFCPPIFVAFFVIAGFELHVADFLHMGWIGLAYVVCRTLGKHFGCRSGIRKAKGPPRAEARLGGALLCQAAVVIGLASFVTSNWDGPAARVFSTVALGSILMFELVGPLLVKRCVVQAGEVKAVSLLSRTATSAVPRTSLFRLTWDALRRMVGLGVATPASTSDMTARHIMRTNVQLVPASANLDQVLSFIERTRYTHFPVVTEGGDLAGVIHLQDVRGVVYDPMMRNLVTAVDLADPDTPIVSPDAAIPELMDLFSRHDVGLLVVAEPGSRRVIGLVEQTDLLRLLHTTD